MKNKIQEYLDKEKMVQNDLAKKTGIDRSYLNKIINNRLPNPTIETAFKISKAFGVKIKNIWFNGD